MNKTLKVPDLELITAIIGIAVKSEASTTQLVLAEIIRASDGGVITQPSQLQPAICKQLGITPVNYRRVIAQLTEMKLITRDQSMILLDPLIRTPFEAVILRQK